MQAVGGTAGIWMTGAGIEFEHAVRNTHVAKITGGLITIKYLLKYGGLPPELAVYVFLTFAPFQHELLHGLRRTLHPAED